MALLFMAKLSTAVGQQVVKGTVTDAEGHLMPGVNIMIKNTGKARRQTQTVSLQLKQRATMSLPFPSLVTRPER